MKTSYFANLKNLSEMNPISISAKSPDWFYGDKFRGLAPSYGILMDYKKGLIDKAEYVRRYQEEILGPLSPDEIYRQLVEMSGSKEPVILCYEKPGDFCHRHIVAEWFNNNLKIKVEEFRINKSSANLEEFF